MWLVGSRGGSRVSKVLRAVTSERPFLPTRQGLSGDLSSFPGFTCCYDHQLEQSCFWEGGAAASLFPAQGGSCSGASRQRLPMRSADGRQSLGRKWKLDLGGGGHQGLGSAVQLSFLSAPLGTGTIWAVLSSWPLSWASRRGRGRGLQVVGIGEEEGGLWLQVLLG